ncbi:MAG: putative zinc-binding protein [Acidobacteriota bacterium]
MSRAAEHLTLVYACSGCSSAAQLANHLAVRLDREGQAEMSCIAGVGGQVRPLLRKLQDAVEQQRPIVAIDGCPLSCVASTLALQGVKATTHLQLGAHGVRKVYHGDFCEDQAQALLTDLSLHVQKLNEQYADRIASGALASD